MSERPPQGPIRRWFEKRLNPRTYRDDKLLIWHSLLATLQPRFERGNWRIGRLSRLVPSAHSDCYRCYTTWLFVRGHSTQYTESRGCFPLCEKCWGELSPTERLPFYEQLYSEWDQQALLGGYERRDDWPAIRTAVLEGK